MTTAEVNDEDFQEVLAQTRHFVRTAVVPREQEILADDRVPDDLREQAKLMGLFGYAIPQQWGGLGLNLAQDVELAMDGSDLHEVAQMVRAWPCNMILPELGGFRFSRSLMQPGFRALRHIVDRGRVWVKLSAPYLIAKDGNPENPEVSALAAALVDWAPERMVWGSAWPHLDWPDKDGPVPEDLGLMEAFGAWISDENLRDRILLGNSETLYGFRAWPVTK